MPRSRKRPGAKKKTGQFIRETVTHIVRKMKADRARAEVDAMERGETLPPTKREARKGALAARVRAMSPEAVRAIRREIFPLDVR